MAYLDKTGLARFYDGMKSRFLLKSAVANDLTVTAAGYVLDARQGKALAPTWQTERRARPQPPRAWPWRAGAEAARTRRR